MPRAKLGMKVQPPKTTPFDAVGQRMLQGAKEEGKLQRGTTPYNIRLQRKLPKATPQPAPRSRKA